MADRGATILQISYFSLGASFFNGPGHGVPIVQFYHSVKRYYGRGIPDKLYIKFIQLSKFLSLENLIISQMNYGIRTVNGVDSNDFILNPFPPPTFTPHHKTGERVGYGIISAYCARKTCINVMWIRLHYWRKIVKFRTFLGANDL